MSGRLRIVFMGSPEFAVPALRAVAARHDIVSVLTQPDRPQGRGQRLAPPPVKVAAEELGLDVVQPEKLRAEVREQLVASVADLFVVVAYGKILGRRVLAIPRLGCVNVHASLLPRYRGAAPIQWAVLRGERCTGVTIMQLDEGMDTGPMILQREVPIGPADTAGSLHDRLAPLGAELLMVEIAGLAVQTLVAKPQPEEGACLAPMLSKEDGRVDFSRPAGEVDCWIRGMDPWPGAFTTIGEERLRLFRPRRAVGSGRPGEVLAVDSRGLLVACGQDAVFVGELQLAGRRRMSAEALLAGRAIPLGTLLGVSPGVEGVGANGRPVRPG
jgi:methionyl-tRNA formyltransferase